MKKLLSILCTAGMTAALLAGCGKAEQTTTEQPATDTAQETEAATETAEVTDTADSAEHTLCIKRRSNRQEGAAL